MHVGIGLPVAAPTELPEWAARAERGPFTTLALLDRLVYDNPDPFVTLALLAGTTSRLRLQTEVLLAPLYRTAVLAKQAATLDLLSGGRFTLGVGIGGRDDDYAVAGVDLRARGRRLDGQLARMRAIWAGAEGVGPAPSRAGGPEVLVGGFADAALQRAGRLGDGFLGAALPPAMMAGRFDTVRASWQRAGRTGAPRLVVQILTALGDAADAACAEITRYYGPIPWLGHILDGLLTTPGDVRAALRAYGDIGADEVVCYCWAPGPDQIDRLADAV